MTADRKEDNRKLDVLVATHGDDGLQRVADMRLPVVSGVNYILTWQTATGGTVPEALRRDDVEIHILPSTGLSHNRNAGMDLARAPYCLIADNDLRYLPGGLEAVIDSFEKHPDIDVATFRHSGEDVYYPAEETDFTERVPKWYNVTSFETAFRRATAGRLRHDTNFGIGAPLAAAEDSVFILDCRRAGLRCRFFPVTIVHHPGASTGYRRVTSPATAMADGAYIRLAYGLKGYPRIPLFAYRAMRSHRMPFCWGLRHLTRGFFSRYIRLHHPLEG